MKLIRSINDSSVFQPRSEKFCSPVAPIGGECSDHILVVMYETYVVLGKNVHY